MPTHPSILLIEDSPGECELFRLALVQTGLDVALYAEHDAEAALHFLNDRYHQSSFQARSYPLQEGGLNRSPTARNIPPSQPSARQDALFPERAPSEAARSASTETMPVASPSLPSLILLDLNLRGQNGCDLLKRFRSDPRFATIPVVVFTTSDDQHDIDASYALGANAYVIKPQTFAELIVFAGDLCRFWLCWNQPPYRRPTDVENDRTAKRRH